MKFKKKQAVVIIHGIGNQFPMDTARELVEGLKGEQDIVYSGPDKEAGFFETRRLRINKKNTDFYEFYWANLVQEPKSFDLYDWVLKLLFKKKPSNRVSKMVKSIRVFLVLICLCFLFAVYKDVNISITRKIVYFGNIGLFSILTFIFFKLVVPSVNLKAALTIGDAVKYLSPSPQNIDSRFRIRQKGIKLLKKLHDKKTENGDQFYSRIIIVGHSLGSVVGYDLITHFWHDYVYNFCPKERDVLQPFLALISEMINEKHKQKFNSEYKFPLEDYMNLQKHLYDEMKKIGNEWIISDFLTIGSPLCHGDYLLAKNFDDFERKVNYREFPLCPPKIDIKLINNQIEKDYVNSISYPINFNSSGIDGFNGKMRLVNHSSQFSFIRWTNIYYKNDFVGGNLSNYFGEGIKNIELEVKGNWFKRKLPFFSHTSYWDNDQTEAIEELKKIIFK